jgi:hypothetical protein
MMLNDDQSNLLLDRAGLLIILVSWAVLPAVVMWWELTRRRLRAGPTTFLRATGPAPSH